ncbi:hypothetical protein JCM19232_6331 [Vibrio ishigakensis]|uniref:4-hydroxy-tetrahydrodipicolinate synthase n=1 Tax=Vibrio ishigakensis TaxID=1481914 RepID=A0A0B8P6Y9_9VIBR|nr:hypothetical protein JCM19232_6331 [Vibrio ishigakensis]
MFSGSIVALITPFNQDGEVDYKSYENWWNTISKQVQMPSLQ